MIIYNGFFRTTGFWRPTKDKYIILHTVPPDMINLWNKRNNSLNIMMWSNTVAVIKSIIKPESTHWAMNTVWSKYQIQTKPMHMSTYFVCLCNFIKNNIVHVLLFGLCYSRKYLGNQHREKMALSVSVWYQRGDGCQMCIPQRLFTLLIGDLTPEYGRPKFD